MTRNNNDTTTYYNVDLTVAAENGMKKSDIKELVDRAIETGNMALEECVMVSKVEEVNQ